MHTLLRQDPDLRSAPRSRRVGRGPRVVRAALLNACALGVLTACGAPTGAPVATPSSAAVTTEAAPSTTALAVAVPAGHVAVLRWAEIGGCLVLGPNCPTWVVYADGTVEVSRTSTDPSAEAAVVATGSVAPSAVEAVALAALATDAATVAASVGPGSCQSCVDGADVVATLSVGAHVVVLDSTVVAFDTSHPLFAALERLMADVRGIALPLVEQP